MTAIRGYVAPTTEADALGVHSLDQFVLAVPDASVAQDFYGAFGLDVRRDGNVLAIKTFGHDHRWGSVVEGAKTKALHHLSFGCYAEDLPRLKARIEGQGIRLIDPPPGFESNGFWFRNHEGILIEVKVGPKVSPDRKSESRWISAPAGKAGAGTRAEAAPGTSLFVCQHHTPDIVWREDFLEQPNGATGLAEVIGIADDLATIEDAYGAIFGERCRRAADRVTIAAGDARIEFLSPGAFVARFGALGEPVSSPRPRLAALCVRVRAFDALQRVLRQHGVPWSEGDGPSLLVGADVGCGTLFEFTT